MLTVNNENSESKYNIYISSNFQDFFNVFQGYISDNSKIFLITDDKVASIYNNLIADLQVKYSTIVHEIKNGEQSKNYETLNDIYKFLIENNADRNSVLITLGGGVVGDLAGFAAATFMRGIRYINIPTTLISQVDSSVGGKTGYNLQGIKNIVGCFYDPTFVYISTEFLMTLSKEEFRNGMGEVIKYGLINSNFLLKLIEDNLDNIRNLNKKILEYIIRTCIEIKCEIVKEDYNDVGLRNILNFGHTVGHGLEISSEYKLPHGIAVALGMLISIKLSERKFLLNANIYDRIVRIYNSLGIPSQYKIDNFESFMYAINHDKKNDRNLNFVLIKNIGDCKIKVPVSEDELLWALKNSILKEV